MPATNLPPLSLSLSPNPMTLYPGSGAAYSGPVSNKNAGNSVPPWTVAAVVAPSSGTPLNKMRWTFSVGPTPDGRNDATLTLAPNSTEELNILASGGKIIIAVKYQGIAQPDYLYVGLTGL